MAVNYNDDRFLQLEEEKKNQLEQTNQQFDDLMNEREDLTNQQQDLINKWEQTQSSNLDQQLQFQKDLIEQQKQEAQKAYEQEAKSAYTDYRKETDAYGVSREQQVGAGMGNTGYSESSKVSMYNTYQNRLATSKQTMDKAYIEFDNAIREAQLTNDVTKAENALTALQQKVQIALEGFNYKSEQTQNKLNWQYQIGSDYYNRYQDVLNQINYENEQAEAIRQYNEQMDLQREQLEYQKEQDRIARQQWEKEYALAKQQTNNNNGYIPDDNQDSQLDGKKTYTTDDLKSKTAKIINITMSSIAPENRAIYLESAIRRNVPIYGDISDDEIRALGSLWGIEITD